MEPIHARRLSLNKIFSAEIPKTTLDIYFENIDLTLDNFQIGSLLELAASFSVLQKKKKFCKNLPSTSVQQKPLACLRYVISSVQIIRIKKFLITMKSLEQRRKDRLLYMAVYAKILRSVELNKEENSLLGELERTE